MEIDQIEINQYRFTEYLKLLSTREMKEKNYLLSEGIFGLTGLVERISMNPPIILMRVLNTLYQANHQHSLKDLIQIGLLQSTLGTVMMKK